MEKAVNEGANDKLSAIRQFADSFSLLLRHCRSLIEQKCKRKFTCSGKTPNQTAQIVMSEKYAS